MLSCSFIFIYILCKKCNKGRFQSRLKFLVLKMVLALKKIIWVFEKRYLGHQLISEIDIDDISKNLNQD